MTSWVLSIGRHFPQHWNYAVQHRMWDLRSPRSIRKGDLVYFWQSGTKGHWVGRSRATEDAYDIDPAQVPAGPWDDWPGQPTYRSRFRMQVLDEAPARQVSWSQVRADLGTKINPGWKYPFSTSQEETLASYFEDVPRLSPVELAAVAMLDEVRADSVVHNVDDLSDDEKKIVKAYQVMRQGQQAFRDKLYKNYGACAITGTTVKEALEAAHIRPYSGPKSNVLHNGLPLRSDLHRLFDRHLLTITLTEAAAYVVRVSGALAGTPYEALDGHALDALPQQSALRPGANFLAEHNQKCDWLTL